MYPLPVVLAIFFVFNVFGVELGSSSFASDPCANSRGKKIVVTPEKTKKCDLYVAAVSIQELTGNIPARLSPRLSPRPHVTWFSPMLEATRRNKIS